MRRFRFWSFLIIPRHREGVAGRTLLGDVMTLQPSQHGWQHPVKSGSEKLQENRELQLSQAFQVRSGSGDGLWVSAWRKEHLSGPEPRFCFCSCDGFIVAPGTGHGFWLYSTRTTEIDVYYYFFDSEFIVARQQNHELDRTLLTRALRFVSASTPACLGFSISGHMIGSGMTLCRSHWVQRCLFKLILFSDWIISLKQR